MTTLAEVVATVKYKKGWKFRLDNWNGTPVLHVSAAVTDSLPPHGPIVITHVKEIPARYSGQDGQDYLDHLDEEYVGRAEKSLRAWIYSQICDVERHEVGECLSFDGERPFVPYHGQNDMVAPYRDMSEGLLL